jgi:diguanylate cyclase (GGDEF)-like protein
MRPHHPGARRRRHQQPGIRQREIDVSKEEAPSGQLQVLTAAAAALSRSADLDTAVEHLLALAVESLGASAGVVYLQDPDRVELQLGVAIGVSPQVGAALEGSVGSADDVVAATSRDRVARTVTGADVPAALAAAGVTTALLRALSVSRGGIDVAAGVLLVGWDHPVEVSAEHEELATALGELAAVAIDRARLASLILERSEWFERMAHTDPLTGLANQRTFARILELELARAARQGSEISLAVFDVDGLTGINERLGHEAGDDVLRAVASVLAESVRLVDTVARHGGDEFVLIAPGAAGSTVAQRVLNGVTALSEAGASEVTVSAGIATFPADGVGADELMAAALAALADARAKGPGRIGVARVGSTGTGA